MWDFITAAAAELFYQRHDPEDLRLGETVSRGRAAYEESDIVILGCPQDEGVRRNQGRPGAALAPAAIRRQLYKLSSWDVTELRLFDLGDNLVQGSLEEIHERQQSIVEHVLKDGKQLIVLGGGNDISYANVSALSRVHPELMAVNIDAHFDVRAHPVRNSGTPYRQLLDEGKLSASSFYELGYQAHSNSAQHAGYLAALGVRCISSQQLKQAGIRAVLSELLASHPTAIFWGLDMDVTAAAPGVSAPNALGLSAWELCELADMAGSDPRSRMLEITEVNPQFDQDDQTSRLAAIIIWHFLRARAKGSL